MRTKGCVLIIIVLVGLVLVAFPIQVHAGNLLVPSQYSTIQAAIDAANPGDTISVSAGTYPGTLTIGKSGISLLGASRDTTKIDGRFSGTVVWINSSNVVLSGFTIVNSADTGWGVHVENAKNVTIRDNLVSASIDGDGVNLLNANSSIVDGNVFSFNLYAVDLLSSSHNRVTNNRAVMNNTIGVNLDNSSSNLVFQNTFAGGQDAVDIGGTSLNNSITRNLIKDMTIFGVSIETDSYHTQQSMFPQNNTLSENTFQRNRVGIKLQNATNNIFYHNDFFESSKLHVQPVAGSPGPPPTTIIVFPNVWDNRSLGGRVGGNFWDNYTGSDLNNDGIGDTPYVIGLQNQDDYPLVRAFLAEPVLIKLPLVASPSSGSAPLTVMFSATVEGSLQFSYSWSFGDGSPGSTLASPVHAYTRPGVYSANLTVRDSSGESDSALVQVHVFPAQPPSLFTWIIVGAIGAGLVGGLWYARRRRRMRAEKRAARKA